MNITIQEYDFHRNGISGNGFYVIRFLWKPKGGDKEENFLATLFQEPGSCAVISLDRLETCGVEFARGNSWRGDFFEGYFRGELQKLLGYGPFD